MSDLAKSAVRDWDRLNSDRTTFLTHWQDATNYELPDRSDYILERTPGQKRMQYVFDTTPIFALDMFAAGMHSLLTSPYALWFGLETEDNRLNRIDRVKLWLEAATDWCYSIFSGARYNFAAESHEVYLDIGSIGTACMSILDSRKLGGPCFGTHHMKQVVIGRDDEGATATVIRKWKYTARQAVDKWATDDDGNVLAGNALAARIGEKVAKAWVEDPDGKQFEFVHAVRPRRKRDAQRGDVRNMAFESVYVSVEDLTEIAVSGFTELPYVVAGMSKLSGETYYRGPGLTMLPDVKMCNEIAKTLLKSAQKVVDPPLQVPDGGFLVPIKTFPGSINYYRANSQGRVEPIMTKGDVGIGVELQNAVRQQILRGFYVEWMLMAPTDPNDPGGDGKGITATYMLQKRDSNMRFLSPMLARANSTFTDPSLSRVFAIGWRRSKALRFGPGSPFPPPPPELAGARLRVSYVSPMALAQKSSQMDAVGKLLSMQLQLRQIDPQSQIVIDGEMMMRIAGRDWNAPTQALKTAQRLQGEAAQAAQAAQAAAAHEGIANLAGAAKDGTGAIKNLADAHAGMFGAPGAQGQGQPQQQAA